jgi:hypothetical protein
VAVAQGEVRCGPRVGQRSQAPRARSR